jgi:hypothetical protein
MKCPYSIIAPLPHLAIVVALCATILRTAIREIAHRLCENVLSIIFTSAGRTGMAGSHFDDRFSRAEHDEWLNVGARRTGFPKNEVEAKSPRKNARIEQVLEAPYWQESRALLKRYVTDCIFSFEETER